MRHLLYYPMIHIPTKEYIIQMTGSKDWHWRGTPDEVTRRNALLDGQLQMADELWNCFSNYLQQQSPFDRIYAEGAYERVIDFKFERRPGMQDCLADLSDTHAPFEKTENLKLLRLLVKCGYPNSRFNFLNTFGDLLREEYVKQNIDTTLQDGERGLLLFGLNHYTGGFDTILRKLPNLELEVYPVGTDMQRINEKYSSVFA